jgi:serralysin
MRSARSIAIAGGLVPVLVAVVLVSAGATEQKGSSCENATPLPPSAQQPSSDSDGLQGNEAGNRITGEGGSDGIIGLRGDDCLSGGDGSDTLAGGEGDDSLRGDDSTDVLTGGDDDDTLDGGPKDDTLSGGDGDDSLDGGADDDVLTDSTGTNQLRGGGGDDVLDAGNPAKLDHPDAAHASLAQTDTTSLLSGGAGDDYINALNGTKDRVRCGPGNDTAVVDFGLDDVDADSCEWVVNIKKPGLVAEIKKPG